MRLRDSDAGGAPEPKKELLRYIVDELKVVAAEGKYDDIEVDLAEAAESKIDEKLDNLFRVLDLEPPADEKTRAFVAEFVSQLMSRIKVIKKKPEEEL